MNVVSVGNPFVANLTSLGTSEFTLEKRHMSAVIVGSPLDFLPAHAVVNLCKYFSWK